MGGVMALVSIATTFGCVLFVFCTVSKKRVKKELLDATPRGACNQEKSCVERIRHFFSLFLGCASADTVVVLRTSNQQEAEFYYSLLLPLQKQLKDSFALITEVAEEFHDVLLVELRTGEFHKTQSSAASSVPSMGAAGGNTSPFSRWGFLNASRTVVGANANLDRNNRLVLCRISLPEKRLCCDFPPVICRLIAAHVNHKRLFPTYAEELLFYLPYIGANGSCFHPHQGGRQRTPIAVSASESSIQTNCRQMESDRSRPLDLENHTSLNRFFSSFVRGTEDAIITLLGDAIDINAALFSTPLMVEVEDKMSIPMENVNFRRAQGDDQWIHDAIHDAFFHAVLRLPSPARPNDSSARVLRKHPFEVWRASRQSRRAAAALYVLDVVSARSDAMIFHTRVVDEVVAQAVLIHHGGSLVEFADALFDRFSLRYVPVAPGLRRAVERRLSGAGGDAGENSAAGRQEGGPEEEEEENREDVLRELPHVRDFILENCITFYNAMLETLGSNHLEEVFGVPATVFPFLPCARESVIFVTHAYDCIVRQYGQLTFDNFARYACDVFSQHRPEIVRHAPRIFRKLNKTRSNIISFEELCRWIALKLSSGSCVRPDAHLLAITMSLRLPLALVLDRREQWSQMECALPSLSDLDVGDY